MSHPAQAAVLIGGFRSKPGAFHPPLILIHELGNAEKSQIAGGTSGQKS